MRASLDFTVVFSPREDGGVRCYSPDLIGLHLSFGPSTPTAQVALTVESAATYLIRSRIERGQPLLGKPDANGP